MPEDNTKQNANSVQNFFTVQHGRVSLKNHAAGKKHITLVAQTQKNGLNNRFLHS